MAERVYTYIKGWGKGSGAAASCCFGQRGGGQNPFEHGRVDLAQFDQGRFEFAALVFQMLDLLHAFFAADWQYLAKRPVPLERGSYGPTHYG